MNDQIKKKSLTSRNYKDLKKSNLDIFTEENDHLLKNLKRPGGSFRVSYN